MKLLVLFTVIGLAFASPFDECSYGESYWCSNLKVAVQCNALQHCMDTVWSHQQTQVDGSEECDFCKVVVGEVRKAITDEKTEAEIEKYVEEACGMIPEQQVADECKDLVKNYLSEVLMIISSELDPASVCSALGLCSGFKDLKEHIKPPKTMLLTQIQAKLPSAEPICTDCKKFFQDMKDMVTSKTTQDEIKQYIEDNFCSQMGALESYCKQMVEAYLPEVFDLLSTEFDPAMVCQGLGFCDGQAGKALLAKMKLKKSPLYIQAQQLHGDTECDICKMVLSELQNLDRDKTMQSKVEDFLKMNLCASLGNLEQACDQSVDDYLPMLFELLASELDPDTRCKSLGLCSASSIQNILRMAAPQVPKKAPVKKMGSSTQCVLCEFIMKEVESVLQKNATTQEIVAALDKVCNLLPDTIKEECTDFVNTYGPAVIALLEQQLSPEKVCTALGLCSGSGMKTPVRTKHIVKANDETCGICETVIQYLDSLLEQNATIQAIEAALEKVCNFLPSNLKKECDELVDEYGPAIVQLIAQFADPKEVCTSLGLCSNNTVQMLELVPGIKATDDCAHGPKFWCHNYDNALKCNAVDHCKKNVWMNY